MEKKNDMEIRQNDLFKKDDVLFVRKLVSAICGGEGKISLTLSGKEIIAFARELFKCILAENAAKAYNEKDDNVLLTKKDVMENLDVSSTTLWLWKKKINLLPIKIGGKTFYKRTDIEKLRKGEYRDKLQTENPKS